jgi:hypothetical protein
VFLFVPAIPGISICRTRARSELLGFKGFFFHPIKECKRIWQIAPLFCPSAAAASVRSNHGKPRFSIPRWFCAAWKKNRHRVSLCCFRCWRRLPSSFFAHLPAARLTARTSSRLARVVPLVPLTYWRRGRDSNPRSPLSDAGFQDRCNQPLCHLSERDIWRMQAHRKSSG